MRYIILLFTFFLCPLTVFAEKHEIAIVSMFKNEAKWLKEWIEYHKLMGVEKFYLYDNNSTDNCQEVLYPYIQEGLVTYIPWHSGIAPYIDPGPIPKHTGYQWTAFKDCIKNTVGHVKWLGILDVDEFITPIKKNCTLKKVLRSFEGTNVGQVAFNWRCFGTSEIWDISEKELLIEMITLRAPDDYDPNRLTKYFVRPEASIFPKCHGSSLKKGYKSKGYDGIQINHYQYRGRKDTINKRLNVNIEHEYEMSFLSENHIKNLRKIERTCNQIEDRSIQKFLSQLKMNMKIM